MRNGRSGDRAWRAIALSTFVAACASCAPGPMTRPGTAAPMNKPVPLGSSASTGTLEAERRALEGTWDLAALEVASQSGTSRVPVQASGTLVYDEYGNLTINAKTTDPAAPVAAREVPMLTFKGRAAIDVVKHELKLMDLTGNANPDEVLSPERRRRYTLTLDTLTLSSFDDQGVVTAVATWRRRP